MDTQEIILEYEHVSLRRKDFSIEDAVFSIKKGYITVLMGENGAGKSTLLSMLMGKENEYEGCIRMCGKDIRKYPEHYLNQVGVISEESLFFMELDALDNEELLAGFYSDWDGAYYRQLLKRLSISTVTPIGRLSRGNYIKFQFAFAMAHHPLLYVLDEPTAGLDPVFRMEFYEMLQELVTDESALLMSTNIWSDVSRIADYRLEIADGRIVGMKEVFDEGGCEKGSRL